ncbi:hypothetical protein V5O48_012804 [Marasmius crinis-equi]|uniref:Uncharacterized protein n=1 Tax=Marasmius crinis-equi TaxID=585013 RepID=A0ABR3F1T4_9AGAR
MSFATYASQFINRQNHHGNNGESSMTSSQPMFFSFTTDNSGSEGEGARTDRGRRGAGDAGRGSMFDSGWWGADRNNGGLHDKGRGRGRGRAGPVDFDELDENDPHLIQDSDEEDLDNVVRRPTDNSNYGDEDPYLRLDEEESMPRRPRSQSRSPSPQGGWLAHQGRLSSSSSSASSSDSGDEEPPPDILVQQPGTKGHCGRPLPSSVSIGNLNESC